MTSNVLSHPGWLLSFLRDGGLRPLPNIVVPGQGPLALPDVGASLAATTVTWADFEWIRDSWRGSVSFGGAIAEKGC